jgi:hypothetical protein
MTNFFQVRRYFPVANLTRTRQAVILEPLRPERFFVRTFNATSLYILSVCEVCGSYQCPYCPTFSQGTALVSHSHIYWLLSWTFMLNVLLRLKDIRIVTTWSNLFRLVKTWSGLLQRVQTCSDLFRRDQTCSTWS